jgi:plastocyanin
MSFLQPKSFILTDYNEDILNLVRKNIRANSHLASFDFAEVMALDWKEGGNEFKSANISVFSGEKVTYLAADVIYDDELTEMFFLVLLNLMKPGDNLWLSIELRFNFTVSEMSLVAHGYRRFLNSIHLADDSNKVKNSMGKNEKLTFTKDGHSYIFEAKRIHLDFPQRVIDYSRVKDVEMWDITLVLLT